ncbi:putative nuclease HARBI1 [Rhagoletis pomonella]|uniref:putative nuclease HARBI1 n=1 Tax=Rhagoletis pomonella TaxID=28610 RepID=UPI00177C7419|nr:putative nuclease HARBI1 [Rhagoletis pomonella]
MQFIKFPREVGRQRAIQQQFYKKAKFPRVIAAMDCTHVKILSPGGDDAEVYRNRKWFFSLNVQTLCDSHLNIMDIVAHFPGSTHDATKLRNSRIYSRFEGNEFGNAIVVADSGYPCNRWTMTPLLRVNTPTEALYNESQIRTRNCVERSYGVWKKRFPVLSLGIRLHSREVERTIVATAVLHNVCNLNNGEGAPPLDSEINAILNSQVSVPSISLRGQSDNIYRREIIQNHFETL